MLHTIMRSTFLFALLASARAHFPLVNGASGGELFSTLATAVEVEDIDRSHATNRVATCSHPYVLLPRLEPCAWSSHKKFIDLSSRFPAHSFGLPSTSLRALRRS